MKIALLTVLAIASLALAGCDDKKDAPAPSAAATSSAKAAPAASAKAGGGW